MVILVIMVIVIMIIMLTLVIIVIMVAMVIIVQQRSTQLDSQSRCLQSSCSSLSLSGSRCPVTQAFWEVSRWTWS